MKQLSVSKILVVSRFLAFSACSQASVPTCVDPGVTNGGPIFLGTIADVHLRPRDQASATLTVDSYLRNAELTEQSQTVKVDWIPGQQYVWRLPVWAGIPLVVGRHVLVMLGESDENSTASR